MPSICLHISLCCPEVTHFTSSQFSLFSQKVSFVNRSEGTFAWVCWGTWVHWCHHSQQALGYLYIFHKHLAEPWQDHIILNVL